MSADPEQPRVSRRFQHVICQASQVKLAPTLGSLQALPDVPDHELIQKLLTEASARAS